MRNYFAIFRKIIIFASWYSAICWICSHTLRGCVDWNPSYIIEMLKATGSHTLRGCVDWNRLVALENSAFTRHTLRGCVDWNSDATAHADGNYRHTLRGCVDWNQLVTPNLRVYASHTLRGCVDWNSSQQTEVKKSVKSHPSWVCGLKQMSQCRSDGGRCVTPFVGVWIETIGIIFYAQDHYGHTLRGCVDWNLFPTA